MAEKTFTDDQVLADPGDFNVAEVVEVFARSSAEEVADAKAIESEGKNRTGIMEWAPPTENAPQAPAEGRFSRDRVLSRDEGPRITGYPYHVIAGALAGDDRADFSREEIAAKVERFVHRSTARKEG